MAWIVFRVDVPAFLAAAEAIRSATVEASARRFPGNRFGPKVKRFPMQEPDQFGMGLVVVESAANELRNLTRILRDGNLGRQAMKLLLQDDFEELFLVSEVLVDAGFIGLGLLRDAIDPRAGNTVAGEFRRGGLEDSSAGCCGVAFH